MKLNYKRTLLVGLAFFAICAFWQLYDHVVPLILTHTFDIGDSITGAIMAVDNVLALFMLPLFGALSDRTKTRWGKRMPYIVVGSFGAAVFMMCIPVAAKYVQLPLFIVGLGLTLIFMASYRSPAVALMPDVTPRPLRSKGNAVINLMGAAGNIIILGLVFLLLPSVGAGQAYRPDYLPVYLALMAIMILCTLVLMLFVNEPKLSAKMLEDSKKFGVENEEQEATEETHAPLSPPKRRSMFFLLASIVFWFMGYNAVTTAFSRYTLEQFGMEAGASALVLMVAQAAAIVSFLPVGIIASRIGRKKCILGGIVLLAVAFAAATLFKEFSILIYVLFVMAGVAWASINVNSYPMVVEMAHGGDVGKFTGYYYTASMAAQIATPILSGVAMEHVGYWTLFPYAALFVALSFITMLFVRHGDAKPLAPQGKLEAFEAMDDG